MSIYCTALSFDGEDLGEGEYRRPFRYQGSHVEPQPEHERAGMLDTGVIPPHIGGHWDDFLRLSLSEEDDAMDGEPGAATVLLDRSHVEALHSFLGEWLERKLPIMQNEKDEDGS